MRAFEAAQEQASGRFEAYLELGAEGRRPSHDIHLEADPAGVTFHAYHHHGTIGQLDLELPQIGAHHRVYDLAAAKLPQRIGYLAQQLNGEVLGHGST